MKLPPNLTMDQILVAVEADDDTGFCLSCGEQAYGVEPDARPEPGEDSYKCESCGECKVYGAEELLIMFSA